MKNQTDKKITIEEAAVEILTVLGGKAHISEINPYIIEHVELTGKTPERSISCSLQRASKVRASKGQRGWWELVSYQEEIAKLKEALKEQQKVIQNLNETYSQKNCVTLQQVEEEIMESPDWPTAKSKIDHINCSGILAETNWPKNAKSIQRKFKQRLEDVAAEQARTLKEVAAEQARALKEVAEKKTIGTLIMDQHNHGVDTNQLGNEDQKILAE